MRDLTSGPEGRLIFYFAVPMLIGNLFQQLYNMAMAGQDGKTGFGDAVFTA